MFEKLLPTLSVLPNLDVVSGVCTRSRSDAYAPLVLWWK